MLGALKARRAGANSVGIVGADRQVPACGTLGALKARRAGGESLLTLARFVETVTLVGV